MKLRLIQNAYIRKLLTRAAVLKMVFARNVLSCIRFDRTQGALGFEKQFLIGKPPGNKLCRLHRGFDPHDQALELRKQFPMFLLPPSYRISGRKIEAEFSLHRLAHYLMVDSWIPDEIGVQHWSQVMAFGRFLLPVLN